MDVEPEEADAQPHCIQFLVGSFLRTDLKFFFQVVFTYELQP